MKKLGLSMIVKDESHVILRSLKSVSPIIDYWTIVDTGSTDGTQEIIKNFFDEQGIPGELIEIEWKDFATSRNVALEAVEPHVDYGIWIDADEELKLDSSFNKEALFKSEHHSVSVTTIYGKVTYTRKNIWKTKMGFKWDGPIHELLSSPNEKTGSVAVGLKVIVKAEGSSWADIPKKYAAHAKILEEHTKVNSDPRWVFYTAQSYRDSSQYEKAIEWYKKRAQIPSGFIEEIFISKFMVARISEVVGRDKTTCTALYQEAHETDPLRGESIKSLIQMYQRLRDWESAYVYSLYGLRYNNKNPYPQRILFLDNQLYDYEMLELHAMSCFWTKRTEEGALAYWTMRQQLDSLGKEYLSEEQWNKVYANEQYFPKDLLKSFTKPTPSTPSDKRGSKFTPKKKKRK
jgi:glycosyltransferase involved in cell wall biosynthesis